MAARMTQVKKAFGQVKHLIISQSMSRKVRIRLLYCYILLVLMYGYETWIIRKERENRLRATEMWVFSQHA